MQLKSVTTTQRNALSSPQAGDVVYNSTTGTIDFYNGSDWYATSSTTFTVDVSYLVIAGGASGAGGGQVTKLVVAVVLVDIDPLIRLMPLVVVDQLNRLLL